MNSEPMYWSVKRELWENRSICVAPSAVAALFLFAFLVSTVTGRWIKAHPHNVTQPYDFAALVIMATTFIVSVFYCLDALHGERRDRSILFWKSLPVSDLTAVLSKATIPLVVLPVVTFVITAATQLIMLFMSSAAVLMHGESVTALWRGVSFFQTWPMLLYHLIAVHSLYYAPIFAWLLLVSAWARRVPFLWAFLPLAAIGVAEKIAFNTSYFGHMLMSRIGGGKGGGMEHGTTPLLGHFTPGVFLSSPGLWIGLALAAAFLAGAVRLRHYHGPL
jgi:ABC-2 type transport system permease protein